MKVMFYNVHDFFLSIGCCNGSLYFLNSSFWVYVCVNLFIAEYSLLQILLITEILFRLSFFSLFLHLFVCIAIYYFFFYCHRFKIPFWSLYIAPLIATFLFLLLYTFVPFISEIPFLLNPCIVLLIATNFFFHILISFFYPRVPSSSAKLDFLYR